jgi:SAM-dependent methyltransferase
MQHFNWASVKLTNQMMDARIKTACSALGWQRTIHYLNQSKIPFNQLKVAEVGCGSGTFALTLRLLGADVTLIDADEQALDAARRSYGLYGFEPRFLQADVLAAPPPSLLGTFDLVSSSGLAEHFTGSQRKTCLAFHRDLLKNGGVARISVPNRFSPWYRLHRGIRELLGTWSLDIEIPFSCGELKIIAKAVGFSRYEVIGNYPLIKDAVDYSKASVSALVRQSPLVKKRLDARKEILAGRVKPEAASITDVVQMYSKQARETYLAPSFLGLRNKFSAGLVLFGVK